MSIRPMTLSLTAIAVLLTGCDLDELGSFGDSHAYEKDFHYSYALKPGGRLAVSDMVELKELPPDVKKAVDAWAGCISGTIPVASYQQLLVEAGFQEPAIEITQEQDVEGVAGAIASAAVRGRKPAQS